MLRLGLASLLRVNLQGLQHWLASNWQRINLGDGWTRTGSAARISCENGEHGAAPLIKLTAVALVLVGACIHVGPSLQILKRLVSIKLAKLLMLICSSSAFS
jgi:hypothetical protein